MSYGRLPFQWTPCNVLRQLKYLMSVIMCPQKQFIFRYFANALRGELNTATCRLSFEDHLPIWYLIYYAILTDMFILIATILESSISHRFCCWTRTFNNPPKYHERGDLSKVSTGSRGPLLNVLSVKFPVQLSWGRVFQISSDRDDRMGAKIKTPKYPWTKIEPKQNRMPDFQSTLNLKLTSHMRNKKKEFTTTILKAGR